MVVLSTILHYTRLQTTHTHIYVKLDIDHFKLFLSNYFFDINI